MDQLDKQLQRHTGSKEEMVSESLMVLSTAASTPTEVPEATLSLHVQRIINYITELKRQRDRYGGGL